MPPRSCLHPVARKGLSPLKSSEFQAACDAQGFLAEAQPVPVCGFLNPHRRAFAGCLARSALSCSDNRFPCACDIRRCGSFAPPVGALLPLMWCSACPPLRWRAQSAAPGSIYRPSTLTTELHTVRLLHTEPWPNSMIISVCFIIFVFRYLAGGILQMFQLHTVVIIPIRIIFIPSG